MRSQLRPALVSLVVLTVITGVIYPLLVTGIATAAFPGRAHGSLLQRDEKLIGSILIAQPFTESKYFWPRPSAASYNGAAGSGSNVGPTNPALIDTVKARIEALRAGDPGNADPIPVDLVTASGSGLDPHVSIAAARYQAARVARARNMNVSDVEQVLDRHVEGRTLGVLGEPRVNVLLLNLALDHPDVRVSSRARPHDGGITLYRSRGFMPADR
jgi:potassium-transporting ATPase KdpC subunit